MNGALTACRPRNGDRDGLVQPRDEDRRAHVAVEPRDEPAAIERGNRADEGRGSAARSTSASNARQDRDLDGIEAHGRERVDFLAHLHRAELGGVGTARTAGHHDGDDQHAELAQHRGCRPCRRCRTRATSRRRKRKTFPFASTPDACQDSEKYCPSSVQTDPSKS